MRRVALSCLLGVALALLPPPASAGEPGRPPFRIGVIHAGYFASVPSVEGLKAGLKAAGLEEGRDVAFDIRFTRGDLRSAPEAAAALVNADVDLIVAHQDPPARAARAATQTIPIVFLHVGDPVAAGLVKEIARPGGNVTGVSSLATELTPKRLEILKAIIPGMRRAWALYHAEDPSGLAAARKAKEAATVLKLELLDRAVRTPEDLVRHLKGLRPGDALLSPPSNTMNIPGLMLDMTLGSRVPAIFEDAFWVKGGALVSYGSEIYAEGIQAARLVAKILRGARPADLPVEGVYKVELAINLKTARALGITVPGDIRVRADHVIE